MEILSRFFGSFLPRLDGPLHFRFILQPTMAIILAIIDGIKDAKLGRVPYFWDMVRNPERRKELFILGLKRLGKVLILAVILDVIYQIKVYHWFYPGETIAVAILLAETKRDAKSSDKGPQLTDMPIDIGLSRKS